MTNAKFNVPEPANEPVFDYLPKSPERLSLKRELEKQAGEKITIPVIVNGEEIYTGKRINVVMPHKHTHILAECCQAGESELKLAVKSALLAKEKWEIMPWEHRASIFLKAAELASGKYRAKLCAATMLGQSKTAYQAEIDSACELADFLRFNAYFTDQIYCQQPDNGKAIWNRLIYRPLEGFVLAVSPFNFTAIGANLCTAPAMLGNTVVWKPSNNSLLSNYYVMKILMEAGLPGGVINFVPSRGSDISKHVVTDPQMSGFHFTGSTEVFESIWKSVGENIGKYYSYPRLVGEASGKDFLFAHSSADINTLCSALIRGAFEYQGQKCSALSRAFIPESIWPNLKLLLISGVCDIRVGDVRNFKNFMGAVIDRNAFNKLKGYIDEAKAAPDAEVICGGYDDSEGYFIFPTIIQAKSKDYKSMVNEMFGPILTIYVYPDEEIDSMLEFCDKSTPYALTGAIFAKDREAIVYMENKLRNATGNFYINDKPTGAVVGQQPFGGARASGTNDKAGSVLNLYRWMSLCSVKENFSPSVEIGYRYMDEE